VNPKKRRNKKVAEIIFHNSHKFNMMREVSGFIKPLVSQDDRINIWALPIDSNKRLQHRFYQKG